MAQASVCLRAFTARPCSQRASRRPVVVKAAAETPARAVAVKLKDAGAATRQGTSRQVLLLPHGA